MSLPVFAEDAAALDRGVGLERVEAPARYDGQQVVRVSVMTGRDLVRVLEIAEGFLDCTPRLGSMDLRVTAAQRAAIERLGIGTELLVADLQAAVDAERAEIEALRRLRGVGWFDVWRPLDEHESFWAQLAADVPNVVAMDTIGASIEGRPIRRLTITGPNGSVPVEDRPVILFNGCQHAREWISPTTVAYIADRLGREYGSDPRVTALLDEVVFYVVPMVNPDGYEYSWTTQRFWRKNRRDNGNGTWGVDLNRNWAFEWGGWGSSGAGSSDMYRGTAPFSEPETSALRDLVLATPNLVAHIDYHSYGQLILYPFGYATVFPPQPDRGFFQHLTTQMAQSISAMFHELYNPRAAHQLYVHAGCAVDWFYGERGAASLCVELPTNVFNPPASRILPTAIENYAGALAFAEINTRALMIEIEGGRPLQSAAGGTLQVFVRIAAGQEAFDTDALPRVWTRAAGESSFTARELVRVSPNRFILAFDVGGCGEVLEYFLEASTVEGSVITSASASDPFTLIAAGPYFEGDCEARVDWTGASLNGVPDGIVNAFDLAYFVRLWLDRNLAADVAPPGRPNGVVNSQDLAYYVFLWEQAQQP